MCRLQKKINEYKTLMNTTLGTQKVKTQPQQSDMNLDSEIDSSRVSVKLVVETKQMSGVSVPSFDNLEEDVTEKRVRADNQQISFSKLPRVTELVSKQGIIYIMKPTCHQAESSKAARL